SGYEALGLEALADDPPGIGPLGGLRALLRAAREKGPNTLALALACDLPHFTLSLLDRVAYFGESHLTVVPRVGSVYQPLFARYAPESALNAADASLAARDTSLQGVLEHLGPLLVDLPLLEGE